MIDKEISEFLSSNQVATICCSVNNTPYCFNSFYAFLEKEGWLAFKTSTGTRHGEILELNHLVAGSVLPDQLDAAAIRGIQFEGIAYEEDEDSMTPAASAYYAQYPIGMALPGKIWIVELRTVKFTDNTRGFGHKQTWAKHSEALIVT